jgi:tetratricopeptide (TPR) repeat protein
VELDVLLLSIEDTRPHRLSANDAVTAAEVFRTEGNDLFRSGNFREAISRYDKALHTLDQGIEAPETDIPDQELDKLIAARKPVHLNIAVCYLKVDEPSSALTHAESVLELGSSVYFLCVPACLAWMGFLSVLTHAVSRPQKRESVVEAWPSTSCRG